MVKFKIVILAILFSTSLFGADVYFETTGTSGLWEDDTAWTPSGPPTASGNDYLIITIKSGHTITANSISFRKQTKIIVEDDAVLTFSAVAVVDDVDVIAGKTFVLEVLDGGTLTIDGNFTTGMDTDLTIDGAVSITGDVALGKGATITVDLDGISGGTLDIGGDLKGSAAGAIEILGEGLISVGGIATNVSDLGTNQLPIELTYFNAVLINNQVVISYQTASEENNDYFTIERSVNGYDFDEIATISGAGNSTISLDYSYVDVNPLSGISYYRLKQTDYDGAFEVFDVVSVSNAQSSLHKSVSFEMDDEFLIVELGEQSEHVDLDLFNINGQLIECETNRSGTQIEFETSFIPTGIYIIVLHDSVGLYHTEKVHID